MEKLVSAASVLQRGSQAVCSAFCSSRCRHRLGSSEAAGEEGGGGGDRVHVPNAASPGVMDGCLLGRGSASTAPSAGSCAQPPTPGAAAFGKLSFPKCSGNMDSGSVNLADYFVLMRPSFSVSSRSVAALRKLPSPPLGSADTPQPRHLQLTHVGLPSRTHLSFLDVALCAWAREQLTSGKTDQRWWVSIPLFFKIFH